MMTRLIRTALIVAAAMLATGCAVYNGTSTDIPLFQEKGELHVEAAFFPLGVPPLHLLPIPYRGTVSYSLTNEVGISASVDALRQTVQAMGGIYRPVDRRFVCELYGKTLNDYRSDRDDDLSDIDDDKLEADIKETIETVEFIENQKGNW
jgi:hypothetical protein